MADEFAFAFQAFRECAQATSIASQLVESGAEAFAAAWAEGRSHWTIVKTVQAAIVETAWDWPTFDRWAQRFTGMGAWPRMWEDLVTNGVLKAEPNRLPLLVHFASSTAARSRDIALWRQLEQPLYPLLSVVRDAWQAEAIIASEAWPRIARGDLSVLPPFFPGDRTMLRMEAREYLGRALEGAPDFIRLERPRAIYLT